MGDYAQSVNADKSSSKLILVISLIPIIYIWILPLLSKPDHTFAEDGCYNGIEQECKLGYSISAYISNSQATGAMALTFTIPIALMWIYKPNNNLETMIPLVIFTLFFGLFLIFSVTFDLKLHIFAVLSFCIGAIIHFCFVLKTIRNYINIFRFLIFVSISCLICIGICGYIFINTKNEDNPLLKNTYWVWGFESLGLSSLILFTPLSILLNK